MRKEEEEEKKENIRLEPLEREEAQHSSKILRKCFTCRRLDIILGGAMDTEEEEEKEEEEEEEEWNEKMKLEILSSIN